MLLSTSAPASAAAPLHPKYVLSCNASTYGDPYVKYAGGRYGGGAWSEGFSNGTFALPSDQYASASGGSSSVYDVWPWISFGPGTSGVCVKVGNNTATRLSFTYVRIEWSVHLAVNCSSDGAAANATYALNVTGDMYDYSASSWLVGPQNHTDTMIGTHSVVCAGHTAGNYTAGAIRLHNATSSTGTSTFTLRARNAYYYFAQLRLYVSATTSGGAVAIASVSDVTATLETAHCTGC